ncbi:GDSL esterase/lipase 7 [Apostasia shenzhenica]|uniref:GDSL esterase/lipase 7 n=1 Tax=Apostasia shenzhenica TaxID=1088818 RepID=A0A2I0AWA4_9ASPA|nr:GDSL esterase/lipase 7 [Apostasia shenzhenica]
MEGNGANLFFPLFFLLSLLFTVSDSRRAPAMFIFGDSLIDNGNNNFIPTIARANFLPYGIDMGFPTGRFSNGLTVTDYGAQLLDLPFPAPYLSWQSHTSGLLHGANFASAAAGILDSTGRHYGARITFNGQIALFKKAATTQLPSLIPGPKDLEDYLSSSIFVVNIGSNDYINNYLLPNLYSSSRDYTPEGFADLLISNFEQQLTSLYGLGARKMVLVGIGPLGCIPSQLYQRNSIDGSCITAVNDAISLFNERLPGLRAKLNSNLPGSFFVIEEIYNTFMDMIQNPANYGFEVSNQACCGNGRFGGELSCLPLQNPCLSRDQHIFWDSFHPTQAANKIIAERCYTKEATDCHPISGYQLSQI